MLALVFMLLFARLGVWQLNRAEYKANLYEEFNSRQTAAALDLNEHGEVLSVEDMLWRRVSVIGSFREDMQFLLDNRVYKGEQGYFVYTPFKLADDDRVLLVNRGWVTASNDRTRVPGLIETTPPVTLTGLLKLEPKTGILLKELAPEQMAEDVFRVQEIKLDKLRDFSGLSFIPVILRLEPESGHGYGRDWPVPGTDENKHLGYAFQWFAFAAVLLVIYLVMNIKKINQLKME